MYIYTQEYNLLCEQSSLVNAELSERIEDYTRGDGERSDHLNEFSNETCGTQKNNDQRRNHLTSLQLGSITLSIS